MNFSQILGYLAATTKVLRALRQRGLMIGVRNAAIRGPVAKLHEEFVHSLRKMEMQIEANDWSSQGESAIQVCNACKDIFIMLMELPKNQINCSIKLLRVVEKGKAPQVLTFSRSKTPDYRDDAWKNKGNSEVVDRGISRHSAGAAICGYEPWQHNFACFCCNDLSKYPNRFICPRKDWEKYYQSILVLPIQYASNTEATEFERPGFLCFDSPLKGAFHGMPNIFDYDEPASYRDSLEKSMCFHVGALCADLLGSVLRNWRSVRIDGVDTIASSDPKASSN